jgi:MarR family transcriptional regulator, organic hydroperoxide resistance regulator
MHKKNLKIVLLLYMKREETVDYQIKATWHAIYRMYNQQAIKNNLTTTIGFVLLNINNDLGTPATKIAPLLGLEPRSLIRILKNMEEKNLIFKQTDANDKRQVRVYLTTEGKIKQEISRKTVITFNKVVYSNISKDKLDTFFDVLFQINALIEQRKIFHNN